MNSVNSSFLRRSGVRNALRKAESNFFLLRKAAVAAGGVGSAYPAARVPGRSGGPRLPPSFVVTWSGVYMALRTDSNRAVAGTSHPGNRSAPAGPLRERARQAPDLAGY